jgi:hypothetical protein
MLFNEEGTAVSERKPGFDRWRIAEAYLSQPLFVEGKPVCLNPFKFRQNYNIQALERCWQIDYTTEIFRLRLEARWQAAKPP